MEAEKQCFHYLYQNSQGFELIKFILPVFTTFLGAWFAFLWQNRRDARKQEEFNYGVLLKTQALFYGFFEVIYSINKEYLDPHKDDINRFQKIKHIGFCHKFPELEFDGLSFILTSQDPDLFQDIVSSYRKCLSTIEAIDDFNQQYKKICDKSVNAEKLGSGQFLVAASKVDLEFLKDFTDIMYRDVVQALKCMNNIDAKLFQFIKSSFRNKRALKAEIIAGK